MIDPILLVTVFPIFLFQVYSRLMAAQNRATVRQRAPFNPNG